MKILWFVIGLTVGLFIALRDKQLDYQKLAEKAVKGEHIIIGKEIYKFVKINIKEEENK